MIFQNKISIATEAIINKAEADLASENPAISSGIVGIGEELRLSVMSKLLPSVFLGTHHGRVDG